MNLELHIIQNFSPSNLNRDDTGSPKDCDFGGVRRARVSSQCWKRSIRRAFESQGLLSKEQTSVRTRLLLDDVVNRLTNDSRPRDLCAGVVRQALAITGLSVDGSETQYLLFLSNSAVKDFADACAANWDALSNLAAQQATPEMEKPAKTSKKDKKQAATSAPADLKRAFEVLYSGRKAADLALFGRMIADRPADNIVAASQVAHAISTHRVDLEFDFYTAVDDLQPSAETGAGMMGTVEYNSACFYRYLNVDFSQLRRNLAEDNDLALAAVRALIRASIDAIPSGKQNSMAALNPPSLVSTVVRPSGLWSLANAFCKPVRPSGSDDLVTASIQALDEYWKNLKSMYGFPDTAKCCVATLHPEALSGLSEAKVESVSALIDSTVAACSLASV